MSFQPTLQLNLSPETMSVEKHMLTTSFLVISAQRVTSTSLDQQPTKYACKLKSLSRVTDNVSHITSLISGLEQGVEIIEDLT